MTEQTHQPQASPRKKPLQARSKATVDAVLAAAAHILSRHGSLTTNAVAERAGVSIGSLYQYFPNKDAILVALIERQEAAFAESIAGMTDQAAGLSLADDLRRLLHQARALHGRDPALVQALEAEGRRLEPHLDRRPAEDVVRASAVRLLGRHGDSFDCPDLDGAARDITAMSRALLEAAALRNENWSTAIDRTVGAVMGYLTAASSSPGDAFSLEAPAETATMG